jgi:hypothetical protein
LKPGVELGSMAARSTGPGGNRKRSLTGVDDRSSVRFRFFGMAGS